MESKAQLLKELDDAREYLWLELASLEDQTEITPGMTKSQIFAHIAGWEALVFEAFREHVQGIPAVRQPYTGIDQLNNEFVTRRQGAAIPDVKLECEINRFSIRTLLLAIDEADYEKPVRFRWGEESVPQFIHGAISHERGHANEIIELKRRGE